MCYPSIAHNTSHSPTRLLAYLPTVKAVWSSTDVERAAVEVFGPRSNAELQQLQQALW